MASGGTVEIQVELEGANKVQGRLNQLGKAQPSPAQIHRGR